MKFFKAIFHHFLLFMACCPVLFSCGEKQRTYNGYSKKDNFYFKLLAIGDGKIKPDTSETLWIDAKCLTLKDSVFWDSKHNLAQGFFVKQNSFSFTKHLFSLAEGDSLQYLIPTAVFFKEVFKLPTPFFSESDSCVRFSVKILAIISAEELARLQDSLRVAGLQQQNEEYAQINNYVTLNFKGSLQFSRNAFMQITHSTHSDSIKNGCKISLSYKGSFLDGRLADFSPGERPFEFTLGQEGQILEGLRLALYHLKRGEKAKIILPSRLAFGSGGSSNGSIAPYTPLLYEVEVLDVKN